MIDFWKHMRNLHSGFQVTSGEQGFTLVEMLVSILILSVIMAGMFSFLWGASAHWQTGKSTAEMTDNARQGLNRMTREIRQASNVTVAQPNQISFSVNFGTGSEVVTYGFSPGTNGAQGLIWRSTTATPDVQVTLVDSVQSVQFTYFGNDYKCDSDGNGNVSWAELRACSTNPEAKIARVDVSLTMQNGKENTETFTDQAWLRNRQIT